MQTDNTAAIIPAPPPVSPRFGTAGVRIPSLSPEPEPKTPEDHPMGGSAQDPPVNTSNVAALSGDAGATGNNKETEFSESQDQDYDAEAAVTLVTQTNQAQEARRAAKAAKKAAAKEAAAKEAAKEAAGNDDCMIVEPESTPHNQETSFIPRCRNLATLMFFIMTTFFNPETDKEETKKTIATLEQMQTKITTSNFSECTEDLRKNVLNDGATRKVQDGSLLFGLPMGVETSLIPVLKWLLLSAGAVVKTVTIEKKAAAVSNADEVADEMEEDDNENEAGSSSKKAATKTIEKTVFTHPTAKSIDQMYAILHPELVKIHEEFKDAGLELSEPMSVEEVMKKDSGFKPIKDGMISTTQMGFLSSLALKWINELMAMNLSIIPKTKSKNCTTLLEMLVYIAKLGQMALLRAAELKKAKRKAAAQKAAKKAANGDNEVVVYGADDGNFWNLKNKEDFVVAFQEWSRCKNIAEVVAEVHANKRQMTKDILTDVQLAEYEDYKKKQKSAENAARTAKNAENARLVKELQAKVEELEKQIGQVPIVAPVEVMGGATAPRVGDAAVMTGLRIKFRDARNDLEDAKDEALGLRTTLGMLENNLQQSEENLHAADAELNAIKPELESTKTKLDAALKQIETLRRDAAVLGRLDPAVQVDERVAEPMEAEKEEGSKKRKADGEAPVEEAPAAAVAPTRSSGRNKKAKK